MKPFKIISISVLILLFSCQKDRKVGSKLENFFSGGHSKKSSSIQSNVSYNSTHDVLVFATKQDVDLLEEELEAISSEIYNRGNSDVIFQTLEDIKTYGYTNGNGNSGDKVKIKDFEIVLEQSNPLSDSVLSEILNVNDNYRKLPPPFIRDVFIDNTQLSSSVLNQLDNSQVPNGIINQIKSADDNDVIGKNYAYEEFLSRFPAYSSLYKKLIDEERIDLENGLSPIDDEFDNDLIQNSFLRLILNERKEVYIGENLYKIYSDCKWVNMQEANIDNAFQDLSRLSDEGVPEFPQNFESGEQGIPITEINNYIPASYTQFNPGVGEKDPVLVDGTTAYGNEFDDGCPNSNFSALISNDSLFKVDFINSTNLQSSINPNETFYQYWNFGDGTGSFESDPTHVYPGFGEYVVKLTTFSEDCGCWDYHTFKVNLSRSKAGCASSIVNFNEDNLTMGANFASSINGDQAQYFEWIIYLENPNTNSNPQQYGQSVVTQVPYWQSPNLPVGTQCWFSVKVTFLSGCISESHITGNVLYVNDGTPPNTPQCVRRATVGTQNNYNFVSKEIITLGNEQFAWRIKDKAIGDAIIFDRNRILAEQIFYEKRTVFNGWKRAKANYHSITYSGYLREVIDGECSDVTFNLSGTLIGQNLKKFNGDKVIGITDFGLDENSLSLTHRISHNNDQVVKILSFGGF